MNTMRRFTLIILALLPLLTSGIGCEPTHFSASTWQTTDWDKREPMAKDFVTNYFRPGMTRAEIVDLLGKPDPGFRQDLNYKIGSFMNDYRVLWIKLNPEGKASEAVIYQTH